jgi:hypothetical protein
VVVVVFSLLAARLKPRGDLFAKPWPLEAKRQLLTERERALYEWLVQAFPNHIVLAQVQLLQVLNFKRGILTAWPESRSRSNFPQPAAFVSPVGAKHYQHYPV